jgi:hypothetical protein
MPAFLQASFFPAFPYPVCYIRVFSVNNLKAVIYLFHHCPMLTADRMKFRKTGDNPAFQHIYPSDRPADHRAYLSPAVTSLIRPRVFFTSN